MTVGEIVPSAGLIQLLAGDAVTDRHKVVWVKGDDDIWRSRERVPASATTSRLLRLQVGPFRLSGPTAVNGDAGPAGRTHVGHDDNAPARSRRR